MDKAVYDKGLAIRTEVLGGQSLPPDEPAR